VSPEAQASAATQSAVNGASGSGEQAQSACRIFIFFQHSWLTTHSVTISAQLNCGVSPQLLYRCGILTYDHGMGYAIIRMQKLKSAIAVQRSFKHAFREQDTPNADPERTPSNTHMGAKNTAEALQRFNQALPDKVRKNAVVMVEYLITASPEDMAGKDTAAQNAYFKDALRWLQTKHGKENLVYAGIHRDETTPHLYAYVVPKDEKGKLNCRSFYGEKNALSLMQTDFAETVGKPHGLERGIEGSKARHTTIREYYGRIQAAERAAPKIDIPEPDLTDRMSPQTYGRKVADSILKQIGGQWKELSAKASQTTLATREAKTAREALAWQQSRLRPLLESLKPLSKQEQSIAVQGLQKLSQQILDRRGKNILPEVVKTKPAEQERDK
jgi:hypothetical protein